MGADSEFDYQVNGTVPVIYQKGSTCWAAAAAMMISWRKQQWLGMTPAIETTGNPYIQYLAKGRALPHGEYGFFAYAAGMKCAGLRSYTPRQLLDLMVRRQSPLMICVFWPNQSNMTHFYVVKRMYGSGTPFDTTIEYHDPLSGEAEKNFDDFMQLMEAATGRAGMLGQILHY